MRFADILGQNRIKDHCRRAALSKKVTSAYIFEGEKSSGKMMLAKAFAQALVCENFDGNDSCGTCPACMKAESGNHPDIIYANHEKPTLYSISEIREQLVSDISIKPYSAKHKIYIIDDAGLMNQSSQNAVLKTIEEPPSYAVIIFLTDNVNMLLSTIRSRCVKMSMTPVPEAELKSYLMERYRIVDYKAEACALYSRGNVGAAINMAMSAEENDCRDKVISILRNSKNADSGDIISAVKELDEEKANLPAIFNLMTLWYRDVLLYKSTGSVSNLVFRDEARSIIEISDSSSYRGISDVIDAIEKTRRRLQANVNFGTGMELLFRAMKEST